MNRTLRASCLLFAAAFMALGLRAAEVTPTVITSDNGEMVSTETETTFTFRKNVVVTGTNIKITCDELVVVANRSGDTKATFGNQEKFKSLIAVGNVRVVQDDREATCGRAEVFPGDDKVVLSGTPQPRVRTQNSDYVATGPIMELYRGERRARIIGGTSITLPPVKDLGYEQEPEKKSPATPNTSAPQK